MFNTMLAENLMPILVLAFGGIVVGFEVRVMLKRNRGWGKESIRIVGLTIVVIAAMFLVLSPAAQEKSAAAFGLLGTVAGYFLGKTDPGTDKASEG